MDLKPDTDFFHVAGTFSSHLFFICTDKVFSKPDLSCETRKNNNRFANKATIVHFIANFATHSYLGWAFCSTEIVVEYFNFEAVFVK